MNPSNQAKWCQTRIQALSKRHVERLEVKYCLQTKSVVFAISSLFWQKDFFKMISLFVTFACEDSKKKLPRFCGKFFQFYGEKCPQGAEDAEVSELCASAPLHPVRCPVIILHNL